MKAASYCMLTALALAILATGASGAAAAAPTDNPVAAYYSGGEGYPAWTDEIRWSNVIDMAAYKNGRTNFEKFENARDELAARGGGVLYYPAGEYDFSDGPFDGPNGRGLLLKPGVVIRGAAPAGKPRAATGKLELGTSFVFGFTQRANAIETGDRAAVWLDGAAFEGDRQPRPVQLQLAFPVKDGKLQAAGASAFAKLYGKDYHDAKIAVQQQADAIALSVEFSVAPKLNRRQKSVPPPLAGSWSATLKRSGDKLDGTFQGTFGGRNATGKAHGALFTVKPETPRDWNLIGLRAPTGKRLKDVDRVGIAWVHLVGAVIYFGPDNQWGETWRTANSWKSGFVKDAWADRQPDGTHPWDPFAGGKEHVGAGRGRLVFGCVLEDAVAVNNSITMGRPDTPAGFGPDGYYMGKFAPRIGVYGSRVFIANNVIPKSAARNFKYRQLTRFSYPGGKGGSMSFGEESERVVLFDYAKACGIDVNKTLLGLTQDRRRPDDGDPEGLFCEGVVVRDNWVYNHGHKGFNVSGKWLTVRDNHNERAYLKEAVDPYYRGGWELTLDGYLQSSPGGNGAISDNLSRAFDLAGQHLWADGNFFNNVGSDPGNDGEGLLCQAHGGTHLFSWALTRNRHERGVGESSYIGAWNVELHGCLIAWNQTAGWVGSKMTPPAATDLAFVANAADAGVNGPPHALQKDPEGELVAPKNVRAESYEGDAVKLVWEDAGSGEIGFRVDRKIGDGAWTTIAYRPPRLEGDRYNPQAWIDFLAPRGKPLRYRVAAVNSEDNDTAVSKAPAPITLAPAAK